MNASPLLELKDISMRFKTTQALDHVSLSLYPGQVLGLIGENGAGKSTLMKIIAGVYPPDEGELKLNGTLVHLKSPADAQQKGISTIYQELTLCDSLTAPQNVFLHKELSSKLSIGPFSFLDNKQMMEQAKFLLEERLGCTLDLNQEVGLLPLQKKQLIEIARALATKATIIIMDEPTAALESSECERLFAAIDKLKIANCGIIYVSHHIDEMLRLCDKIQILRDGKDVGTFDKTVLNIDTAIALMIGKPLEQQYYKEQIDYHQNVNVLCVENLNLPGVYQHITFSVKKGEIVGFAGLQGSGKSEVIKTLFGLYSNYHGSVMLNNKIRTITTIQDAINYKIAYLPEDRKTHGLFLDQDVAWNSTIAALSKVGNKWLKLKLIAKNTAAYIASLGIKTEGPAQQVGDLSGGNQQKVMLARWLFTEPDLFMFEEPTRGIDVQAKVDVYKEIAKCARAGKGVILVSSDSAELIGICDKVLVMCEGKIVMALSGESKREDNIAYYSLRKVAGAL